MGNFTEKETEVGEDQAKGLQYGLSAMQGWRAQMEDDHIQLLSMPTVRAAHAAPLPRCSQHRTDSA